MVLEPYRRNASGWTRVEGPLSGTQWTCPPIPTEPPEPTEPPIIDPPIVEPPVEPPVEELQGEMLVMSYVKKQEWDQVYEAETALERGTIFPDLDLPFVGEGACRHD